MPSLFVKQTEVTPDNWTQVVTPNTLERDDLQNFLGDINKMRKWLDKVEEYVKESLPAKFDSAEFEYSTPLYFCRRDFQVRVSLDMDKLKQEMGEEAYKEWFDAHKKETEYYRITIKEVKP